jgi:trk system potassium uptake protein TrkH
MGVLATGVSLIFIVLAVFGQWVGDGMSSSFFIPGIVLSALGTAVWYWNKDTSAELGKREGYLIVALGWILIAIISAIPFAVSGALPSIPDAIFESVSGLTTTGATVIERIEELPQSLLLWRSLTQWIGGMGIIVLTVAIFPLLGIGGVELFVAESPGPTYDKIHPRIAGVAKRLWFIYLGLTVSLILLLHVAGMTLFDAFNHGFTTMATGGFSTHSESIAYFDSAMIEYIIIAFMVLAGTNYTLLYFGMKGQTARVWQSDEFKFYLLLIVLLPVAIATLRLVEDPSQPLEEVYRSSAFQIVSLMTTTGYITSDYTLWGSFYVLFFFLLLFLGASAGSTSGGIKLIRHLVFFKNSLFEFKRLLHPRALIRTKIDGRIVMPRVLTHILVFLLLYMMLFVLGSLVMIYILRDSATPFLNSVGAVATSLGNVGPAIGELGPAENFVLIPGVGKFVLCMLMLLGRLELFAILILFSPYFWRSN